MSGKQVGEWNGVMVIGQSPWVAEDQRGEPFVGDSGELLRPALEDAGLHDYYLTNVVRCAPFLTDGKVESEHIKACAPYLEEEIQRLKPTWILALGNEAIERLLGRRQITGVAGKEQVSERYGNVFPVYHPSYILRGRGREASWKLDIQRFVKLAKGETFATPPVEVELLDTVDKAARFIGELGKSQRFTYDFENRASSPNWWKPDEPLPWWHKDALTYTISFSIEKGRSSVLPLYHKESPFPPLLAQKILKPIAEVMADRTKQKSPHNGLYDDLYFYRLTGVLPYLTFDTMPALHLLDESAPKGLKWNGMAHLNWPNWDINAKKEHPLADLYRYNGYDTAACWEIWDWEEEQFEDRPALGRYYHRIVVPMLRCLDRMVANGVHINRHTLAVQMAKTHREYQEYAKLLPVENPNSRDQIATWFFDVLKLPIVKMTKGGARPAVDNDVINRLAMRYPEAKNVTRYAHPRKMEGTYLRPAARTLRWSFDGRYHYEMRTTSAVTGRLASGVHTIPRDSDIRSIFHARPGWELIAADYAQIEARIMAWVAAGKPSTLHGARGMLGAFASGQDVYVLTAAAVLGKLPSQVTTDKADPKNERQMMGKVPTLAKIYRISPKGFREYAWNQFEIELTEAQAVNICRRWDETWPEISALHTLLDAIISQRGFSVDLLGRVRRLPDAIHGNRFASAEAVRQGIDHIGQSSANGILQRAHVILQEALDPERALIVINHHDALVVEAREDYVAEAAKIIGQGMGYAPLSLVDLGLTMPRGLIEVEVSVGPWGKSKPLDNAIVGV